MLPLYNNLSRCLFRKRYNVLSVCYSSIFSNSLTFQSPKVFNKEVMNLSIVRIPNLEIHRNKHNKTDKQQENEEEDSDSDDDMSKWKAADKTLNKISKVIKSKMNSLRLDHVVKAGLGISRSQSEVMFYQGKIRINGKKPPKKSVDVNIGDEVDVIRSYNKLNPNNLNISRLEILDYKTNEDSLLLFMRKYKMMTVENYEDPFTGNFDE